MYDIVLFDLDGTLTDPKMGITQSVQYALAKYNIHESDLDKLEPFIGPPLHDSFKKFYQFTDAEATQAIAYYREYFSVKGMYENKVYPGIPELLRELCAQGKQLIVATSKPTVFSEEILRHFHLLEAFSFIVGSNLDGTRVAKTEVIECVLNQLTCGQKKQIVMVGDRMHDIVGAQNTGLDSIAVTYGYGSVAELEAARPTYLVQSVAELRALLQGGV